MAKLSRAILHILTVQIDRGIPLIIVYCPAWRSHIRQNGMVSFLPDVTLTTSVKVAWRSSTKFRSQLRSRKFVVIVPPLLFEASVTEIHADRGDIAGLFVKLKEEETASKRSAGMIALSLKAPGRASSEIWKMFSLVRGS